MHFSKKFNFSTDIYSGLPLKILQAFFILYALSNTVKNLKKRPEFLPEKELTDLVSLLQAMLRLS